MRRATSPLGARLPELARLGLGIAVAALLTAGGAAAMAFDLDRSFVAPQVARADPTPTSPSGRRGVVLVGPG